MQEKSPQEISLNSEIQSSPTVSEILKLEPDDWTDAHIDAIAKMLRARRVEWEQAEGKSKREKKRTPRKSGASQLTLADLELDLDA